MTPTDNVQVTLDAMEWDVAHKNLDYYTTHLVIDGMLDIPSGPESVEALTL